MKKVLLMLGLLVVLLSMVACELTVVVPEQPVMQTDPVVEQPVVQQDAGTTANQPAVMDLAVEPSVVNNSVRPVKPQAGRIYTPDGVGVFALPPLPDDGSLDEISTALWLLILDARYDGMGPAIVAAAAMEQFNCVDGGTMTLFEDGAGVTIWIECFPSQVQAPRVGCQDGVVDIPHFSDEGNVVSTGQGSLSCGDTFFYYSWNPGPVIRDYGNGEVTVDFPQATIVVDGQ